MKKILVLLTFLSLSLKSQVDFYNLDFDQGIYVSEDTAFTISPSITFKIDFLRSQNLIKLFVFTQYQYREDQIDTTLFSIVNLSDTLFEKIKYKRYKAINLKQPYIESEVLIYSVFNSKSKKEEIDRIAIVSENKHHYIILSHLDFCNY